MHLPFYCIFALMKKICTFAAALLAMISLMCLMCSCQGGDTELSLVEGDPDNLVYTCEHQTVELQIDSNRSWKASCSEDWLEMGESSGKAGEGQLLSFTLTENKEYSYRNAQVTLKAGGQELVLTIVQEPRIYYYLNEDFNVTGIIVDEDLPSGWYSIDNDGDGWGWRCVKYGDTPQTYAYSASYYDDIDRTLSPDNYLVSPPFTLPSQDFRLRWESATYDTEYPGDKYEVYTSRIVDGRLELLVKIYEGQTSASADAEEHLVSLENYDGLEDVRITFRHFDSVGLGRLLITNVEVSNR